MKGYEIKCFVEVKDARKSKQVEKALSAFQIAVVIGQLLHDNGIEPEDDMIHVITSRK